MKYIVFFNKYNEILPTEIINARSINGSYYNVATTKGVKRCYRLHDVVEAKAMQFKLHHEVQFAEIREEDIDEKQLIKLANGTLCITETEFLRLKDTASMKDILQPINKL